jgi:hypothetical protein
MGCSHVSTPQIEIGAKPIAKTEVRSRATDHPKRFNNREIHPYFFRVNFPSEKGPGLET